MTLNVVILAAGQGTRMRSAKPKVLHPLAGRPLLAHVLAAAEALPQPKIHLVVGHGADQVRASLANARVDWVEQAQQLGTGHAVMQALPLLDPDAQTLILYGDVPLITPATLTALLQQLTADAVALLTVRLPNPTGYGRILRNPAGEVVAIVEEKDATPAQRAIDEVNTGIMALPTALLARWLPQLSTGNAQGEYYLTDLVAMAVAEGKPIATLYPASFDEVTGVNTRQQLAELERSYQRQQANALMAAGVSIIDPARFDLRGRCQAGEDVTLDVNVVLEGDVTLGDGCTIGPNCLIRNSVLAAGVVVEANSLIDGAVIGPECTIGPFARIRPGTRLAAKVRVGNFVETKNAVVEQGSKMNHLSYIGDATIGAGVNIGAGTITCNYDGKSKHRTTIESGVFVGSNTALVAPVTIGRDATVAAGSTITKEVPAEALGIARGQQRNVDGWKSRR
ncbi:MAG: bifunctional UDP-N-acetylglucosamine diphosphorylase/glucosamine-1-phosphate N-acetyltransferase GlmU [Pseudomonadales bacterium]|nr:bifunctional UDP-N-acetylglucosamine diphosphorylase/glucosamine-1-phosphate N-acetyltransferase GlmU [Pseudomonadales bacterium]